MILTEKIKAKALELGYTAVGICSAEDFTEYIDVLTQRADMYDFYIKNTQPPLAGARPRSVDPSAKSIIVAALDFSHIDYPKKLLQSVGRAYLARAYEPLADSLNGVRLAALKSFLEDSGCHVLGGITLPERMAGARAGVSTYGKNNFAYVKGASSFAILTSLVVDKELDYDEPTMVRPCPEGCTLCIDACPTGAILAPGTLDPKRCIGYHSWFTQERFAWRGMTTHIPHDIREKMGTRIHGCDVCQEVCPRNKSALAKAVLKDAFLERLAERFDLAAILHMDDAYYAEVIHPIMYNYITEKNCFRRNAAIAIGNSGDRKYLPALKKAMWDEDAFVREYAAWALGRLGGEEAKAILMKRAECETDKAVRTEIETALIKI